MTNEDLRKAAELLEIAANAVNPPAPTMMRLAAVLRAMADAEPVECLWKRNGRDACYATPQRPQWIGLTDSEIDSLQATTGARDDDIRIIEAALRAKNGVAA